VSPAPGILARGPWEADQVETRWLDEAYEPPPDVERLADAAVDDLRERGSPSHELQPSRWALRLVRGNACDSLTALCVVRAEDGRWLAGHRADWVSTWAGRWALGAGGAVDVGESPTDTLARELREEWRLEPERLTVEALVALPDGMAMLVGLASVPEGCEPVPDHEHDKWTWWPADIERWPVEADPRLRLMARLLDS
jgi:8-oxo-dGTP diphosphatase